MGEDTRLSHARALQKKRGRSAQGRSHARQRLTDTVTLRRERARFFFSDFTRLSTDPAFRIRSAQIARHETTHVVSAFAPFCLAVASPLWQPTPTHTDTDTRGHARRHLKPALSLLLRSSLTISLTGRHPSTAKSMMRFESKRAPRPTPEPACRVATQDALAHTLRRLHSPLQRPRCRRRGPQIKSRHEQTSWEEA